MTFLLALLPTAHAAIYIGNPELTFEVDRSAHDVTSAVATIAKVRVNYCGGGYTDYTVDHEEDLVTPWTIIVSGGDFCGVRLFWGSVLTIENTGYFTLEYDEAYTEIAVANPIQPVALTPFTVVNGAIYGGNPGLYLNIHY